LRPFLCHALHDITVASATVWIRGVRHTGSITHTFFLRAGIDDAFLLRSLELSLRKLHATKPLELSLCKLHAKQPSGTRALVVALHLRTVDIFKCWHILRLEHVLLDRCLLDRCLSRAELVIATAHLAIFARHVCTRIQR
jgi:hypothetical protein